MSTPQYKIVRWKRGWSLEGPDRHGMPMDGFSEALKTVSSPGYVIDPGIEHHLRVSGFPNTVCVIGEPGELQTWRDEVAAELESSGAGNEEKWIRGTDTGLSSLAIFSALAQDPGLRSDAALRTRGETPADGADIGRCLRLLEKFPEWRGRLGEIPIRWPQSAWGNLVARWAELEVADEAGRRKILDEVQGERSS